MYLIDSFNVDGVPYALRDAVVREDITRRQATGIHSTRIRVDGVQRRTPIRVSPRKKNLLDALKTSEPYTLKGEDGGEVTIGTDGGLSCTGIWSTSSASILELFDISSEDITGPLTLSFIKEKSNSTNVCVHLVIWAKPSDTDHAYDWGSYYIDADNPYYTVDPSVFDSTVTHVQATVESKSLSTAMSGTAYFQLEHGDVTSAYVTPGYLVYSDTYYIAGKNMLALQGVELSTRDSNGKVSTTLVEHTTDGLRWKQGSTYYVRIPCNIPQGLRISGSYKHTGTGLNSIKQMRIEYDNGTLVSVYSQGLVTEKQVVAVYLYKEGVTTPLTEDVYITEIQVEIGKQSTAYEPYREPRSVNLVLDADLGIQYIPADEILYENYTIYPTSFENMFAGEVEYSESILKRLTDLSARVEALEKAILNL